MRYHICFNWIVNGGIASETLKMFPHMHGYPEPFYTYRYTDVIRPERLLQFIHENKEGKSVVAMFCLVYIFLRQNPDLNLRNISNCKNAMELEFMSKSSKRVKTNCISLKSKVVAPSRHLPRHDCCTGMDWCIAEARHLRFLNINNILKWMNEKRFII